MLMQPDTLPPHKSPGDLVDPPCRGNQPPRLFPEVLSHQACRLEPHRQHQEDLWRDRVHHVWIYLFPGVRMNNGTKVHVKTLLNFALGLDYICLLYALSYELKLRSAFFPQLQLVCAIAILLHSHSRASVKRLQLMML